MSRRRRPWSYGKYVHQRYTWKHVLATCEKHGITVTEGRKTYTDTGKKMSGGRIYVRGPNYHEGTQYHFAKNEKSVTWLRCQSGNPGYRPLRYLMDDLKRCLDETIEAHLYTEKYRD